jgi:hypothetical protein
MKITAERDIEDKKREKLRSIRDHYRQHKETDPFTEMHEAIQTMPKLTRGKNKRAIKDILQRVSVSYWDAMRKMARSKNMHAEPSYVSPGQKPKEKRSNPELDYWLIRVMQDLPWKTAYECGPLQMQLTQKNKIQMPQKKRQKPSEYASGLVIREI